MSERYGGFFKTDMAYENWKQKYQYMDETPIETFRRVAKSLASVEKNPEQWEDKFFNVFVKVVKNSENGIEDVIEGLKNTTGGRITANLGTHYKNATAMNCFINGHVKNAHIKYVRGNETVNYEVDIKTPDTGDDLFNIFLTIMEQAKTLATEGGYGINFDFIRPRGSLIKGTGIKHPGVVSYMQIWDSVSECIVKGDNDGYYDKLKNYLNVDDTELKKTMKKMTRKGAMLGTLSVNHPDIEEFIRAKQEPGNLTKFNISVLITDEFMKAVEKDDYFDLTFKGEVYKRVKARELYDLIMESTYNRAEPGVLFYDSMNRNNPISYLGKVNSTNPCFSSDMYLYTDFGVCQFGKHVDKYKLNVLQDNRVVLVDRENEDFLVKNDNRGYKYVQSGSSIKLTQEKVETIKISFDKHFMPIVCTKNHRFFTENGAKKAKDLKKGDMVLFTLQDFPKFEETELDDLAFMLGIADGNNSVFENRFILPDNVDELVKEKFGWSGVDGELPDVFFETSRKYKYASNYVAGLFIGGGEVEDGGLVAKIVSGDKEYLQKIGILLSSIGICTYIKSDWLVCEQTEFLYFYEILKAFYEHDKVMTISKHMDSSFKRKDFVVVDKIEEDEIQDVFCIKEDLHKNIVVNGCSVARCGEIPGNPDLTTVCLLGSVNLPMYVYIGSDNKPCFDWEQYKEDIKVFARMLDNVNDLSYASLPSYEWAIKNIRQYGMGVNGLGSTLMMLKIPYNSKKAVQFTEEIQKIKENLTWQTSALLAKEKGVFPAYDKEKFTNTEYFKSDRISDETKDMIRKYGVRNAKTTTNPPLGNSSILCDNVSNGIEPVFMLEYERKSICEWPDGLNSSNVKKLLKEQKENDFVYWQGEFNGKKYYYEPHNRGLCEVNIVRDYGYQWLLDNYTNEDHYKYLITTDKLKVKDHLAIQKVVQYYLNQSVSKTSNVPNDYPFEDFKNLYIDAWKMGLNGFTTYRSGSMESVLSSLEKAEETKEIIKRDIKLPDEFVNGPTSIIKREGMKFYIHFSYLPEDSEKKYPVAVWIYTNSKGETIASNRACKSLKNLAINSGVDIDIVEQTLEKAKEDSTHNKLARMVSLCLRHNILRSDILVALSGIEGDNVSSLLTAVRKFIGKTIEDGTKLNGMKCVSCGSESLRMESGCYTCQDCGYSGCG